jgi:hypothetical protein
VAWIREELLNNREITPEARPRDDRDIGEPEDTLWLFLSSSFILTSPYDFHCPVCKRA